MVRRDASSNLAREAHWREHVRAQPGSGRSIRGYCRAHGLKESAFYWWRAQLARRERRQAETTLVPVRVMADSSGPGDAAELESVRTGHIEVVLPGGRCVRLLGAVERAALTEVLAVLGIPPC